MATTYQLIASTILSSTSTSVTFTGINQSYKDLLIRTNIRSDIAADVAAPSLTLNNDGGANYYYRYMRGNNATSSSATSSSQTEAYFSSGTTGSTAPTGTFAGSDFYVANYANTNITGKEILYWQNANTSTASSSWINMASDYYNGSAAITSLTITIGAGSYNMQIGSTFYLYGI